MTSCANPRPPSQRSERTGSSGSLPATLTKCSAIRGLSSAAARRPARAYRKAAKARAAPDRRRQRCARARISLARKWLVRAVIRSARKAGRGSGLHRRRRDPFRPRPLEAVVFPSASFVPDTRFNRRIGNDRLSGRVRSIARRHRAGSGPAAKCGSHAPRSSR